MNFAGAYKGRSVLLTGDTGFKGAWLARWLTQLGARVTGYALPPERPEDLFPTAKLDDDFRHVDGNVQAIESLASVFQAAAPDIVFHLAAQAVVRRGHLEPVETFATNVLGTVNVLECVRQLHRPVAVVVVTSDKCYANQESDRGYRETDPLGGDDIYSASKGAAEVVTAAYRKSFFEDEGRIRVASARAGNVIGPGDWADARLIPDAVRSLSKNEYLELRNPASVRPWQHVLEPLSGYLWLGARLQSATGAEFAEGFNFGPEAESCISVAEAADIFVRHFEGIGWRPSGAIQSFRETKLLRLSIEKAAERLAWRPVWDVEMALRKTAQGYRALAAAGSPAAVRAVMDAEISAYVATATAAGVAWASDPRV